MKKLSMETKKEKTPFEPDSPYQEFKRAVAFISTITNEKFNTWKIWNDPKHKECFICGDVSVNLGFVVDEFATKGKAFFYALCADHVPRVQDELNEVSTYVLIELDRRRGMH